MQMQFLTQMRFSMALAVTEGDEIFGAQADIGMFVSFPSGIIIAWFHADECLRGTALSRRLILTGPTTSSLSKLVWFDAYGRTQSPKILDMVDAFMDLFTTTQWQYMEVGR